MNFFQWIPGELKIVIFVIFIRICLWLLFWMDRNFEVLQFDQKENRRKLTFAKDPETWSAAFFSFISSSSSVLHLLVRQWCVPKVRHLMPLKIKHFVQEPIVHNVWQNLSCFNVLVMYWNLYCTFSTLTFVLHDCYEAGLKSMSCQWKYWIDLLCVSSWLFWWSCKYSDACCASNIGRILKQIVVLHWNCWENVIL